MATENDNEKGVSPQRSKGGVRRWYGAARGLALSFWAPFVCIASSLAFGFPYLPLIVAIIVALVGALVPGRPHVGRSAWRIVREVMAWLFAAVHLAIVALWLYFATGAFDFVIIPVFRAAVCDADRIVIRDGVGFAIPSQTKSRHSLKSRTRRTSRRSTKCSSSLAERCRAVAAAIRASTGGAMASVSLCPRSIMDMRCV